MQCLYFANNFLGETQDIYFPSSIYEAINWKSSNSSQKNYYDSKSVWEKRTLRRDVGSNFQLEDNSTLEQVEEEDKERKQFRGGSKLPIFFLSLAVSNKYVSEDSLLHLRTTGLLYWMCAQPTEEYRREIVYKLWICTICQHAFCKSGYFNVIKRFSIDLGCRTHYNVNTKQTGKHTSMIFIQ